MKTSFQSKSLPSPAAVLSFIWFLDLSVPSDLCVAPPSGQTRARPPPPPVCVCVSSVCAPPSPSGSSHLSLFASIYAIEAFCSVNLHPALLLSLTRLLVSVQTEPPHLYTDVCAREIDTCTNVVFSWLFCKIWCVECPGLSVMLFELKLNKRW